MRTAVSYSGEMRRILSLPRRRWETAEDLEELRQLLTRRLKSKDGTLELWPIQAAALRDIYEHHGLFAPIPVGGGKALITLLAATLMGARRPMLIVPAHLRDTTLVDVIPEMAPHWQLPENLEIRSVEELSRKDRAEVFETSRPDLILIDEAHRCKDPKAAVTRRLERYLKANPETVVVLLSGSMADQSLRDYWHLIQWTHGPSRCPLPTRWQELRDWADALDEEVHSGRANPGALTKLSYGNPELEAVRLGFQSRLLETPGVVGSLDPAKVHASLIVHEVPAHLPGDVAKLLRDIRETWADPNGYPLMEALHLKRLLKQVALGYWLRWDPPPPIPWLRARKAWAGAVRNFLTSNRRGIDTEDQVKDLVIAGEAPSPIVAAYKTWSDIASSFVPNPVPEWVSHHAIHACEKWLKEGPGIVWAESPHFGIELATVTGHRWFGAGDSDIVRASGPIIASRPAHYEGKNLHQWNRMLVTTPPKSNRIWEQMIGREHRPRQKADEVHVGVFLFTPELWDSLSAALRRAKHVEQTLGTPQKLGLADITIPGMKR